MDIITDLMAIVLPSFNNRAWMNTTPDGFADRNDPFLIMQMVGGRNQWYVDNSRPEYEHYRIQFFVWGARVLDVEAAIRSMQDNFSGYAGIEPFMSIEPYGSPVGSYNEVLKLHGMNQDFGFQHRIPIVI